MPGLGRYPCPTCHYVASNRRMLARHAVLIHSVKSFKCPLCPFITRYAANWYRHKRDQHGLTKLTTCEVCGFFASSTEELAQHKESEHLDLLQLSKYEDKYAKERLKLGAESTSEFSPSGTALDFCETILEEGGEFQEPLLDVDYNETDDFQSSGEILNVDDSITFSLPLNGGLLDSEYDVMKTDSTETSHEGSSAVSTVSNLDSSKLKPLRIRRSYCCDQCGLLTSDPREYLYHCRDVHGERISVHECKWCIYASKHVQKLQRHCNLVHRELVAKENELKKQREAEELELKKKREAEELELKKQRDAEELELKKQQEAQDRELRRQLAAQESELRKQLEANTDKSSSLLSGTPNNFTQVYSSKRNVPIFKCNECSYQTRNKVFMNHHEKTVHSKKKYKCLKCGYGTNDKSRYTKHIKYHNLPKTQCEFCFFKTAYKWNMDRHMKNHVSGVEGAYSCTLCNFTTSSKQSLKLHVTNHHDVSMNIDQQGNMAFSNDKDSHSESEYVNVCDDDDEMFEDSDISAFETQLSTSEKSAANNWTKQNPSKKKLKCSYCDFRATWPFEIKKHEENHRSSKKHECPLCGMRFEHIAWLTKHLNRIHKEHSQVKNITDALERMKPGRKKPTNLQNATVLPMFQEVLTQNNVAVNPSQSPTKPSMLSTLLKKPLPTNSNRFSPSKQSQSANSLSTEPELPSYLLCSKQAQTSKSRAKSVPTCNVCGYKTRWSSELERHMRVHTHEKPFRCPKCKYHCKWKGDLNRHLMKYHGIKVPPANKKSIIPKLKLKKASSNKSYCASDWETVDQETNHNSLSTSSINAADQECPLDLRLAKSTFPYPYMKNDILNIYDFEDPMNLTDDVVGIGLTDPTKRSPSRISPSSNASVSNSIGEETFLGSKKRYKCPFCLFSTSTASRFHVHIVQHYNKRPFMCSLCGYRSNWEWDITKHIRLKGCKDKAHNKACVLLTDETGRRNYDKYEKYLTDVDEEYKFSFQENKSTGVTSEQYFETRHSERKEISSNTNKKSCTYDFKNIASNFESDQTDIVMPNLKLESDINDLPEDSDLFNPTDFTNQETETLEKISDYRHYYCKHCNYKHSTKRVVVSHLSVHAGLKPFRCRTCGVASNWRHVIVRHVKDIHKGNMSNVEDRIRYTQEGHGIRLTSVNKASSTPSYKSSARFGCNICPYTCDKEYYIKFHMKQHKQREGAIYQCSFCPYFVKFKKSLSKHLRLHKDANLSNESFSEDAYLERCKSDDPLNVNNPFSMTNYDSLFDKMDDSIAMSFGRLGSNEEQTSTPKIKRHICKQCPYTTDNKTQFLYHKQFHRPNPSAPFKCNACSYWATMQHLLTQHMKVHSESYKDFSNGSFEATFASDLNVESVEHFTTANTEQILVVYVKRGDLIVKMFKCSQCPMMNKKRANVRVHQRMHGVIVKNGKFACTFCNYQCLNQGGLTNHIKIHQRSRDRETFYNRLEANKLTLPDTETPVDGLKRSNFSYFCLKCPALFKSSSDFNIHKKFHGSSLPLPCPHCDYKAKHKPHLSKHLQVHTAEYIMKRNASQGPPVASHQLIPTDFSDVTGLKNIAGKKKIDQMLLLEASEVNQSLKIPQDCITKLHTCVFCPASFFKTSTLAYHISLHGSGGEFKCSQCDYSTTRSDNLDIHLKVHPEVIKKIALKRNIRSYCCSRCPAVFYKQDRYNRHFELHGKNYRYACDQCDYSVRFAANLNKHKKVHFSINPAVPAISASTPDENNENHISTNPDASLSTSLQPTQPPFENAKNETDDKKIYYICDRCPYAQHRKDAIQSHQRRHWLSDGVLCLYCDYSSMNSAKLRDHLKIHIQPSQMFPPQAFMKYEKFEIWCKEEQEDIILFEDEFLRKSQSSDKTDKEKSTSRPKMSAKLETSKVFDSLDEKYTPKSSKHGSSKQSSKSSPVVVLSDIFTNHNDLKRFVPDNSVSLRKKLKIKNLQSTSSIPKDDQLKVKPINGFIGSGDEKKSCDSHHKPNIVVKIKVENCLKDNREKTTYSVSTKETGHNVSDEYKTSKNAQPESDTSEDLLSVSKLPNLTKTGNETVLIREMKSDSLVKRTCEQGTDGSKDSAIPVVIVADITPECVESFELQKNHDSLANGDLLTNLT